MLAAVAEFSLGWFLPGIGSSLYQPVLVVLLVAVAIFVVGLLRCELWERRVGVDWGLWIIGGAVIVGAGYLDLVLSVAVFVLGLVIYLLWRRYPSMRGGDWQQDARQVPGTRRQVPKAAWVLGMGSAVVFSWLLAGPWNGHRRCDCSRKARP